MLSSASTHDALSAVSIIFFVVEMYSIVTSELGVIIDTFHPKLKCDDGVIAFVCHTVLPST